MLLPYARVLESHARPFLLIFRAKVVFCPKLTEHYTAGKYEKHK